LIKQLTAGVPSGRRPRRLAQCVGRRVSLFEFSGHFSDHLLNWTLADSQLDDSLGGREVGCQIIKDCSGVRPVQALPERTLQGRPARELALVTSGRTLAIAPGHPAEAGTTEVEPSERRGTR